MRFQNKIMMKMFLWDLLYLKEIKLNLYYQGSKKQSNKFKNLNNKSQKNQILYQIFDFISFQIYFDKLIKDFIPKLKDQLKTIQDNPMVSITISDKFNSYLTNNQMQVGKQHVSKCFDQLVQLLFDLRQDQFIKFIEPTVQNQISYYFQQKPLEQIIYDSMSRLINGSYTHKLPENYQQIIKSSEVMISLSYGNPSASLDSITNARAHIFNTQFNIEDGGGDSTLFIDSPITTVNVFNSIYGSKYKDTDYYELYQIWFSISLKAFPPVVRCLDAFQTEQLKLVPQKPIILFEFSILPASITQISQDLVSEYQDGIETIYIVDKSYQNAYYYLLKNQNQDIESENQQQQDKQYYIPMNMLHITGLQKQLQELNIQNLKDQNSTQFLTIGIQRNIVHMIHSYFAKMVSYIISLQLSRTFAKLQLLNNEQFYNDDLYKLAIYLQQQNSIDIQQQILKSLKYWGIDGLRLLLYKNLIQNKKYNDIVEIYKKQMFQNSVYENEDLQISIQPQHNACYQYLNSNLNPINTQTEFLKYIYNINIEERADVQQLQPDGVVFQIFINQSARIQKRYKSQASYQTFIPDVITIPGISLHPADPEKQGKCLQIDLDGFAFRHRLDVLLLLFSQLPQYLSYIQQNYTNSLIQLHDSLFGNQQNTSKKAFSISSKFISLWLNKLYRINKILITEYLQDHDVIDIVQEQDQDDDESYSYTIIFRIIKLDYKSDQKQNYDERLSDLKLPNEDTLFNEYDFFIDHKAPKHRIDVALLDKEKVYEQLEQKLQIKQLNGQIQLGRGILSNLQYQVQSETLIRLMPQVKYLSPEQQNLQILIVKELFKHKLFCGCFRQIYISFDFLQDKDFEYVIGESEHEVRINSGLTTIEYGVENFIDKYMTNIDNTYELYFNDLVIKQSDNPHIDLQQNEEILKQQISQNNLYKLNNQNIIILQQNGIITSLICQNEIQNEKRLKLNSTIKQNYNTLYLTIDQSFLIKLSRTNTIEKLQQKNLPAFIQSSKIEILIQKLINQLKINILTQNIQIQLNYLQYFLANLQQQLIQLQHVRINIELRLQNFDVLKICKKIKDFLFQTKLTSNKSYIFQVDDSDIKLLD